MSQSTQTKLIVSMSIIGAILSGVTYFFVAELGAQALKPLLEDSFVHMDDAIFRSLTVFLSLGAVLCFGAFSYKAFSNLSIIPRHPLSMALSVLAPMSASSFFTACLLGCQDLGMALPFAIVMALILYSSRTLTMVDGSVKFPDKAKELFQITKNSFINKEIINLCRLLITMFTAIGFSIASTDNIFDAFAFLLKACHVPEGLGMDIPCYILACLGAAGLFPMIMYWTYRGILQLTAGGVEDEESINQNPTDRYTWMAAAATIPVIFGSLGSVTSLSGHMFGQLGTLGLGVKVSTSIIYSVGGAVPGLSTIFRATPPVVKSCVSTVTSCVSSFFNTLCCRRKREDATDEKRQSLKGKQVN